jgi:hypothetical protein
LSFGDLLGLLLFLVFIILPAINRMQRRGPGVPPPGAPRVPAPGAPGRPAGQGTTAQQRTTAQTQPTDRPFPPLDEDDDLARRLAEARERVRQAMGQRGGQAQAGGTAQAGGQAPTPPRPTIGGPGDPRTRPPRPLVSPGRDDGLLGTPLPAAEPAAARSPRPMRPQRPPIAARSTMAARDLSSEAPAVRIERLDDGTVPRAALRQILSFDANSVRDGLVWHQVLSAPRARRRVGGGPFPER